MSQQGLPYRFFPLGDSAITIDFGNCIDENINLEVINRYHQLKKDLLPGMIEIVPAYSSLTIHYDILKISKFYPDTNSAYGVMTDFIEEKMKLPVTNINQETRLIKVPVCYDPEFARDLEQFTSTKNISTEELINIHTSKIYKVFMIGFLPGFAYMGEVDEKIAMPRKQQPNIVASGSIGIAGKQTGIYPLISPGGWHIIGRTPLKIFNPEKTDPVLLRSGDTVQFYSISKIEYENY